MSAREPMRGNNAMSGTVNTKVTKITKSALGKYQRRLAPLAFRKVAFVFFVSFVLFGNLSAQQEAPYTYAITGARIVPV
ncbi:MAG TPA: hypothetical protein VF239_15700, partial [Vicinamibacterales bacterium]